MQAILSALFMISKLVLVSKLRRSMWTGTSCIGLEVPCATCSPAWVILYRWTDRAKECKRVESKMEDIKINRSVGKSLYKSNHKVNVEIAKLNRETKNTLTCIYKLKFWNSCSIEWSKIIQVSRATDLVFDQRMRVRQAVFIQSLGHEAT